jgi:HEAT repeat protein
MLSELIERLASGDAAVRRAAAGELHEAGAAAVPLMIETVRRLGPSPQYSLLMDALGRLGRVAFDPVCAALATAQTREERRTFAWVLRRLGESALPGYISALGHPSSEVRRAALAGIGGLKEAGLPAAPVIAPMLGHADKQVRDAASWALVSMGSAVIPLLQDIRATGPGRARPAALYCLAEAGGENALSSRDRRAVERLIRVKLAADHPVPVTCCFLSWIAVATSDQRQVMKLFGLTPAWPATFPLGIAAADRDGHGPDQGPGGYARVFVTPPLDGWTLLIGPWCNPAGVERRG